MSVETVHGPSQPDLVQSSKPPLNSGDHLSRAEFERRYQAHPEIKKAELIEGVVYLPSPVRHDQHGHPHFNIITWLGLYCASVSDRIKCGRAIRPLRSSPGNPSTHSRTCR